MTRQQSINMSTIQTAITRLLGIAACVRKLNLYVLKHWFQIFEPLLCSPQWPGRAEVHSPAKFLSQVASVSWHQVRHGLCRRRVMGAEGLRPLSVYTGVETFRKEFDVARTTLNIPSGPLPIGAGFLGWKLEEEAHSPHIALLELALENSVRAIWLSFGEDLGRWIELVRNHDQKSGKSPKTLVFVQVNSVDEALFAVQKWNVDVLVAQGNVLGPLTLLHH